MEQKSPTEEEIKKIEGQNQTTINTRLNKIQTQLDTLEDYFKFFILNPAKKTKDVTVSTAINNSHHGFATLMVWLLYNAQKMYENGEMKNAVCYFLAGILSYFGQNFLHGLKISLGKKVDLATWTKGIADKTGFHRRT